MSEERSPMQREADRRAHSLADIAIRMCGWLDVYEEELPKSVPFRQLHAEFHKGVLAYEEIEERQQKEATANRRRPRCR